MAGKRLRLLDRLRQRRSAGLWQRTLDLAPVLALHDLRVSRSRARATRQVLDKLLIAADARLVRPSDGADLVRLPPGADWAWRPDPWAAPMRPGGHVAIANKTEIADGTTIFHDCPTSEVTLRQTPNTNADDRARYGLRIDVLGFEGTFLSLVLGLPEDGMRDLSRRHVIRVEAQIATERPLQLHARLNIRHGPNVEQITRPLSPTHGARVAEFDLGAAKIQESRIEDAWVDLFFAAPKMNLIQLRDVVLSRRLRADM